MSIAYRTHSTFQTDQERRRTMKKVLGVLFVLFFSALAVAEVSAPEILRDRLVVFGICDNGTTKAHVYKTSTGKDFIRIEVADGRTFLGYGKENFYYVFTVQKKGSSEEISVPHKTWAEELMRISPNFYKSFTAPKGEEDTSDCTITKH